MRLRYWINRLAQIITACGGLLVAASLSPMARDVHAIPITIDMSTHGFGPFDKNFFQSNGVLFTEGAFVSLVQGDHALGIGRGSFPTPPPTERVAGLFAPAAVTSISVRLAPSLQGTTVFRLAALDVLSNVIASKSVLVTQDLGDPEHSGFGYFGIELSRLPGAVGFFVDNTFVRSSFPNNEGLAPAGLSSVTFNTVSFGPVPKPPVLEPATLLLFWTTAAGLWLARWAKKRKA